VPASHFFFLYPEISCDPLNPFYAFDPELFDFQLFRFSFGETLEEAIRNRKSKFKEQSLFLTYKVG
jgi:hypothetical protein